LTAADKFRNLVTSIDVTLTNPHFSTKSISGYCPPG
jgi:hypothetical protein